MRRFRRALGFVFVLIILPSAVGLLLFFAALFGAVVLILVQLVRVVAQLITIAQIRDDLPRQPRKGRLIFQDRVHILKRAACLILDEPAPKLHGVLRTGGKVPAGGQMPHKIARGCGQRHITGLLALIISAALRVMADLGIDVAGSARHVARANRLAPCGLHRLVEVTRHVPLWGITRMGLSVVIPAVERQRICRAARQKNLVSGHPA